jgi:hypothetical protein
LSHSKTSPLDFRAKIELAAAGDCTNCSSESVAMPTATASSPAVFVEAVAVSYFATVPEQKQDNFSTGHLLLQTAVASCNNIKVYMQCNNTVCMQCSNTNLCRLLFGRCHCGGGGSGGGGGFLFRHSARTKAGQFFNRSFVVADRSCKLQQH